MKKKNDLIQNSNYITLIADLKDKIRTAQVKATLSVNTQLIQLYWDIGKMITEKQQESGWGDGVIEQIAQDLSREFKTMQGFSRRNLYRIKQWHGFYADYGGIVPQLVAQIPWGHNALIISKIKDHKKALWYVQKTVENGQVKTKEDNPSIGLILCKDKNTVIAEYALRGMSQPMGVSEYKLTQAVPDELKTSLPTFEEFEAELSREADDSDTTDSTGRGQGVRK